MKDNRWNARLMNVLVCVPQCYYFIDNRTQMFNELSLISKTHYDIKKPLKCIRNDIKNCTVNYLLGKFLNNNYKTPTSRK